MVNFNVSIIIDANQPVARHFNSGSHSISDMKIRTLCPISGIATIAAKDRTCVSFPNLKPYTPLVLTSVFPSFSVTCLFLTCSDINRFNAAFVFIVFVCLLTQRLFLTLYIKYSMIYIFCLFLVFYQIHLFGF